MSAKTVLKSPLRFRAPPIPALLATIIGVAILCGLGAWQVQRLQWKETLLSHLETAYTRDRPPLMRAEDIETLSRTANPYRRVRLSGTYAPLEFALGPRTHEGAPGYHLYTPLKLTTGGAILVNRGWIPLAQRDAASRPESVIRSPVTVTGLLRPVAPANMFVPANSYQYSANAEPSLDTAETDNLAWYRVDLPAMAQLAEIEAFAPLILYADEEIPPTAALPVRGPQRWLPANNHKQYAVFWFSMALILLGIFYIRFVHPVPRARPAAHPSSLPSSQSSAEPPSESPAESPAEFSSQRSAPAPAHPNSARDSQPDSPPGSED